MRGLCSTPAARWRCATARSWPMDELMGRKGDKDVQKRYPLTYVDRLLGRSIIARRHYYGCSTVAPGAHTRAGDSAASPAQRCTEARSAWPTLCRDRQDHG